MIETFTKAWFANLPKTRQFFEDFKGSPSYEDIVKYCITMIQGYIENTPELHYDDCPDPDRITEIDHGDYQGSLLYIIPSMRCQPSTYWSVMIYYGSCSGCDTLKAINFNCSPSEEEKQPPDAVKGGMDLALHIIQRLKLIHSYELDNA